MDKQERADKIMKKKLNEWQLIFNYGEPAQYFQPFTRRIDFGILKFTSFPEKGAQIQRPNYKGFKIAIEFFVPIRFIK